VGFWLKANGLRLMVVRSVGCLGKTTHPHPPPPPNHSVGSYLGKQKTHQSTQSNKIKISK